MCFYNNNNNNNNNTFYFKALFSVLKVALHKKEHQIKSFKTISDSILCSSSVCSVFPPSHTDEHLAVLSTRGHTEQRLNRQHPEPFSPGSSVSEVKGSGGSSHLISCFNSEPVNVSHLREFRLFHRSDDPVLNL